ncbi:MAG: hypothetical protein SEPTF4163_004570 [Sporothrix epigloea]
MVAVNGLVKWAHTDKVKSFWLGWGSLCVAGGAAYYFAKKSINADRQARLNEQRRKQSILDSLEHTNVNSNAMNNQLAASTAAARVDAVGSPSQESSSGDPAPTRHAPATEAQRVFEKSKYEASVPFRSPKGDRFS